MIGIVIQQYYVDAVQALDILNDAKTQATAGTVLPTVNPTTINQPHTLQ